MYVRDLGDSINIPSGIKRHGMKYVFSRQTFTYI